MPVWAQIVLGLFGTSGAVGTIVLGIMKARDDRRARQDSNSRADRVDVITLLTNELSYAREEAARERVAREAADAKVDALQQELFQLRLGADHAADVASAALLAFRHGQAKGPDDAD